MIEINELTKRYEDGVLALDHVTYKVEQGEIFCLLGANGASKTTTINILLDFIQPTSGHAFICPVRLTLYNLFNGRNFLKQMLSKYYQVLDIYYAVT